MKCSLSQGSDKIVIVICKLASNSIRKQKALKQLIKSATLNSLTIISHFTAAYQPSLWTNNFFAVRKYIYVIINLPTMSTWAFTNGMSYVRKCLVTRFGSAEYHQKNSRFSRSLSRLHQGSGFPSARTSVRTTVRTSVHTTVRKSVRQHLRPPQHQPYCHGP